jgi:DNA repair exonuclease SbcCD ATPase subunit
MTDQPLNKPQDDDAIASDTDNEQDFESAFEEYSKASTPADERDEYDNDRDALPEPDDEDPKKDDPSGEQSDDLSEKLKTLETENERLRHSDASQRGRLGAYQRQINEHQRKVQELESAKPATQEDKPQDDDQQRQDMADSAGVDDWKEFKEDFPDMARAFESRLNADQQTQAQLKQEVAELRSTVQPMQEQAHQQQLQSEYARLESRHADWREVVNAPEFDTWLTTQNPSIQALTGSDSADDASALLDFYKGTSATGDEDSRAPKHDKRKARLENAQTVSRRGAATRGGAPEEFDAAFEHYAAKKKAR